MGAYKQEALDLIAECENEAFLKFLCSMIKSFKKKWGI